MNPDCHPTPPTDDAQAVEAIRNGDRERYRELVERHADKVFAIAWCRLGDRDLAEEASQEAFISAYRRLPLLGHTERFGAWIAAIARNAAINLGIRRRGELRKRERWALEQDPPTSDVPAPEDPATSRDALRDTLQELPPIHRECLVLFYLEGRSVAEAAQVLGVSENAFKVRLHRARSVLRDALEVRLESGLDRLRAPTRLAHAVMVALPAPSAGLALFGGVLSGLAKVTPFGFFLFAFQLVALIPGLAVARWFGEKDLANFKEPDGFRARLYRRFLRRMLIAVGIFTVAMVVASRAFEFRHYAFVAGTAMLISALEFLHRLRLLRNPVMKASFVGILLLGAALLATDLLSRGLGILYLAQGLFFAIMAWVTPRLPQRMDHSLFARATHGLVPPAEPSESPAPPSYADASGARLASRRFAAFLGRHFFVDSWRLRPGGLELRLAPAVPNVLACAIPFYWGKTSRLLLGDDGRIEARLGDADKEGLAAASGQALPSVHELEDRVAHALQRSRTALGQEDEDAALRWLGHQSTETIFVQDPTRTASVRGRLWILRVTAVLMSLVGMSHLFGVGPFSPQRPRSPYQPVALEPSEVRTFLARLGADADATNQNAKAMWNALLYRGVCLPATHLFPASDLPNLKKASIGFLTNTPAASAAPANQLDFALGYPSFLRAIALGFLEPEDLRPYRLDPESIRLALPGLSPELRRRLFEPEEIQVKGHPCTVLTTDDLALRVEFLARNKCLDLVDLAPGIPTLVGSQILSTNLPPGRCPTVPIDQIHGLFATRYGDFLRDTRDVLVVLEAAGALDRIDHDACVAGILRLHRGKGLFAFDPPEQPTQVRGDAANTWFAFESLRILGALDQVPDLADWQFRVSPGKFSRSANDPEAPPVLACDWLEAWCLREKFASLLPTLGRDADRSRVPAARVAGP